MAAALGAQLWAAATPAQAHTIHHVPRSTAWTSLAASGAGTTLLFVAIAATGGAVTAAALSRGGPGWRPRPGLALVAAMATVGTAYVVAGGDPVGSLHAAAAAVWVGSVMCVLAVWPRRRRQRSFVAALMRRFSPVALVAGALTIGTGIWNLRRHIPSVVALHTTTYGRILVAKLVVVGAVVVLGGMAHRRRSGRWLTAEAAGLAGAVFAAALLLAVPVPFRGTVLRLGEVVPPSTRSDAECASRHLGHLLAVREVNALRPGAVRLTSAPSARQLAFHDGARALLAACDGELPGPALPVPAYGPAGARRQPSSWAVAPDDGAVGAGLATFLTDHRIGAVTVVSDGSSRAMALVEGIQQHGAARLAVQVVAANATLEFPTRPDAVVVATGWQDARRVVPVLLNGAKTPVRGTYLAPWLLSPSLLQPALGTASAQLTVASSFDPQGGAAIHYLDALARFAPGQAPSGPGFTAYLEARVAIVSAASGLSPLVAADRGLLRKITNLESATALDARPGLAFFTPTRATILPPSLGHAHGANSAWVPGGQLAAISGLVLLLV